MNTYEQVTSDDNITQAACDTITQAHNDLDRALDGIRERVETAMLDHACEGRKITEAVVVAQIIMEELFAHVCDPEAAGITTALTTDNKKRLVEMADHMGPDYAQALYHAAVFITKVA